MKTGILLVNLGTPDSSNVRDVKKYLKEFLNDPRVIDLPMLKRWPIVNLFIVPFRAARSAKLYEKVWTSNGSPLFHYSLLQHQLLQKELGSDYQVELAMRYQSPSIENALEKFRKPVFNSIKVIPLFPQYASASTGSVHEKIMDVVGKWQVVPHIEFVNSFHDDKLFIDSWQEVAKKYFEQQYDHILFSFHGLPERQILKADCFNHCLKDGCCDTVTEKNAFCYRAQCFATARLIAERFKLEPKDYTICFQSRLGKTPWIKPYSDHVITDLAKQSSKRLLVFAPAFVADCLETIYEIGTEYNELFKKHGGEKIQMVESLNDHPKWIEALAGIAKS